MRSDSERLLDMLEALEAIERYVSRGQEDFIQDELIRVWVAHHIQVLGEAAARISPEFREQHSQIPWARVVGMRNILVHQYFGVDWQEIWDTAEKDLPFLASLIRDIVV